MVPFGRDVLSLAYDNAADEDDTTVSGTSVSAFIELLLWETGHFKVRGVFRKFGGIQARQ